MENTQFFYEPDIDINDISNILLLHGLEGKPDDKLKYLKELFPDVQIIAPNIDYKNDTISYGNHSQKGIMDFCENVINTKGINLIIGTSAGGRLGFILKEKYDIFYVLFNPALLSDVKEINWLEVNKNLNNHKGLIITGRCDKIVPTKKLLRFLGDYDYRRILNVIDTDHNIPEKAFKEGIMRLFNLNINKCLEKNQ